MSQVTYRVAELSWCPLVRLRGASVELTGVTVQSG